MTTNEATATVAVEHGKHDREARQRALLGAAVSVFADFGFDTATTREVARRAGCSEGLIHRYFGGKRGLLLAVLRSHAEVVGRGFRDRVPQQVSVAAEIAGVLVAQMELMWERRDFMRVAVSRAIVDSELAAAAEEVNRTRSSTVAERLRRHQEAGRIRADVDIERVASALTGVGFALGFMEQVVFSQDREELRRAAAEIAGIVARGIEATPPDRREGEG